MGQHGAAEDQPASRPPDTAALALLLVASAAVVARRRHPVPVLGVTAAATGGWLALRDPYGPVFLPLCLAGYTVAAATPGKRFPAIAAWVAALLAVLVAVGVSDGRERLYDQVPNQLPSVLLAMATLLLVPLWIGWATRTRRQRTAEELRRRRAAAGGQGAAGAAGGPRGPASPGQRAAIQGARGRALFRAGFPVLLDPETTWSWSARPATGPPRSSWSGGRRPTWS